MNMHAARKQLEKLSAQMLADRKVDIAEAHALLSFVEDYVDAGKEEFTEFRRLLLECTDDKKIDDEESALLIKKLEETLTFLKLEQIAEWTLVGAAATVIAVGLLALI